MPLQKRRSEPNPDIAAREQTRRAQAGAQGIGQRSDARGNSAKQRVNQQRMGVAEDHKTEQMKKRHRGTFP